MILDSSAVEHPAVNRRVVGSNPTRGVFFIGVWSNGMTEVSKTFSEGSIPSTPAIYFMREWLSGRASPCQGEGRGFESRLALFFVLQSVLEKLSKSENVRFGNFFYEKYNKFITAVKKL